MEQTANEIDNTIRFLEDREKKKIGAIWVRAAVDGAVEDDLAGLKDACRRCRSPNSRAPGRSRSGSGTFFRLDRQVSR